MAIVKERTTPDFFNSPTDGRLDWEEVFSKMIAYMGRNTQADYEAIIGTDSQAQNGTARPQRLAGGKSSMAGVANFVSAIILRRRGNGGIYFWSRETKDNIYSLKQRMQMEALTSLVLAERVTQEFAALGLLQLNLGIHLDIGPNGLTKDLIAELEGMIKANGFRVATKPSSWGASHVADRHV